MANKYFSIENPAAASANSEQFGFFRAFFEIAGRSIHNAAVFFQGLTATIHGMYQMMSLWSRTSRAEKSVQAFLLQEYERRYSPEKDQEPERVLTLTPDSEKSHKLLQLWQNQANISMPEVLTVKQNEFILNLSLRPTIHHLDFSGFSFSAIGQTSESHRFIEELLKCNPHITRISFHDNDIPHIPFSITQTIALHRQLYMAHEELLVQTSTLANEEKCRIQAFYVKKAPDVITRQQRATAKKLTFLDGMLSPQTTANTVRGVNGFFSKVFSSLSSHPTQQAAVSPAAIWNTLREGVASMTNTLQASLKAIGELTFSPAAPRSYRGLGSKDKPNFVSQTEEMQRILALWRKWQKIKLVDLSSMEKNEWREQLFSEIYYFGEEKLLPLFRPEIIEPEVPREKQKALYTNKYHEADAHKFYGARATIIIAEYEEAARIRSDDEMVQWLEETKVNPSNLVCKHRLDANRANKITRLEEEVKVNKAAFKECKAEAEDFYVLADAHDKWATQALAELEILLLQRNALRAEQRKTKLTQPCMTQSWSLPSMSDSQVAVSGPRSQSDGDEPVLPPVLITNTHVDAAIYSVSCV